MEWLVSDQNGLFAMGTPFGIRTRKYHGFLSGIAGRTESSLLADLDLACFDHQLLTHSYAGENGTVHHPDARALLKEFASEPWPTWTWALPEGTLSAQLAALENGGLTLRISWHGTERAPFSLKPFWAMRPLHSIGGAAVEARPQGRSIQFRRIADTCKQPDVFISSDTSFQWHGEETWYRNFSYAEELTRGYSAQEDLFCAGSLATSLSPARAAYFYFSLEPPTQAKLRQPRSKLEDFILRKPAGVVAGFPWFGEWGRDTFIALPGIVAGVIDSDFSNGPAITSWCLDVLDRWSKYLESDGMLPNVITPDGPQWDSSDATLWWTHALASLWTMAEAHPSMGLADPLKQKFSTPLKIAIESIRGGRHRFLRATPSGLVEVTADHTTWMDARLNGKAATPRIGLLPEINALWIQARALRQLWSGEHDKTLVTNARAALEQAEERERPNTVFLHSLPFAPAMICRSREAMERDAALLRPLVTPVGLRTLAPGAASYTSRYEGDQATRDRAYHQGPVWGWLKGHYEMANQRFRRFGVVAAIADGVPAVLSTIPGHFSELFDAEEPWSPRGAPAQAWSLACSEEARIREAWRVDATITQLLETALRGNDL